MYRLALEPVHPPYRMHARGYLHGDKAAEARRLTTHICLLPTLRMYGDICPVPLYDFVHCTDTFTYLKCYLHVQYMYCHSQVAIFCMYVLRWQHFVRMCAVEG